MHDPGYPSKPNRSRRRPKKRGQRWFPAAGPDQEDAPLRDHRSQGSEYWEDDAPLEEGDTWEKEWEGDDSPWDGDDSDWNEEEPHDEDDNVGSQRSRPRPRGDQWPEEWRQADNDVGGETYGPTSWEERFWQDEEPRGSGNGLRRDDHERPAPGSWEERFWQQASGQTAGDGNDARRGVNEGRSAQESREERSRQDGQRPNQNGQGPQRREPQAGATDPGFTGRGAYDESPRLPAVAQQQLPYRQPDYPLDAYSYSAAPYAESVDEGASIDLRKYLWLLFKHRWLIAGSAAICVVVGLIMTLLDTPIYRATATIQINRDLPKIVNVEGGALLDSGGSSWEFYQTQYQLLRSRALAEKVASNLNLQDDPDYLSSDQPSALTKIKRLLFGGGRATPTGNVGERQKAAAGFVRGSLQVSPVGDSNIVSLSVDSPNPKLAQKVVNAVADAYIAGNLERRYESTEYAKTFLEERLAQLKASLETTEKELVAYAEKQRIIDATEGQTLAGTNLAAANDALAEASRERTQKELLLKQIEATKGIGLPKILENEAIADLRSKQRELAAEYQDKLSQFKPAFPEMLKLQAQIDEIDRQIASEVTLIKESVKAELDAAVSQEQSLADRVEALKSEVSDFRGRSIQYNILQREVDTNRQLYDALLQRYKEIGVAGGVGVNNISIVDAAGLPGAPYKPSLSRNLTYALMLGLLIGGAGAFVREHFDDTFKSPDEVEKTLGLPLLGIIPSIGEIEDPGQLFDQPRSALSEAYRSLRTALQFSTSDGLPKSLLVTSSRAGEGKSTSAITLAQNFAQIGMRVLLIDADLRKPALHRYLDVDHSIGLTNYLAGNLLPPDAFVETELPGLTVMPCGPTPPNPSELLVGPKMLSLLTIAMEEFDLVVIDGPPVAGLADAPLLSSIASGTLLVIDSSKTRRGVASAALKRLQFARAQLVGAVITKLDLTAVGYSYGYGYGYGETNYYGDEEPARLTHRKKRRA